MGGQQHGGRWGRGVLEGRGAQQGYMHCGVWASGEGGPGVVLLVDGVEGRGVGRYGQQGSALVFVVVAGC
jgi:hypothetical protein